MSDLTQLGLIFIGAALVHNILLVRFLGLCPFFGVSTRLQTSIGMSLAVAFVMTVATGICWVLFNYLLLPLGIAQFLYIVAFILVIASLVQLIELVIRKTSPPLYKAMGIYLPLITTNCAVLATATEAVKPGFFLLNVAYKYTFIEALIYALGMAAGFGFVIVTFSAMRERLELAPIPPSLRGAPIAFITAALYAMAFVGLSGLFGV